MNGVKARRSTLTLFTPSLLHSFRAIGAAAFVCTRGSHSPWFAAATEDSEVLWRLVPTLPLPAWVAGFSVRGGA